MSITKIRHHILATNIGPIQFQSNKSLKILLLLLKFLWKNQIVNTQKLLKITKKIQIFLKEFLCQKIITISNICIRFNTLKYIMTVAECVSISLYFYQN